jgi:hypothetical protein
MHTIMSLFEYISTYRYDVYIYECVYSFLYLKDEKLIDEMLAREFADGVPEWFSSLGVL